MKQKLFHILLGSLSVLAVLSFVSCASDTVTDDGIEGKNSCMLKFSVNLPETRVGDVDFDKMPSCELMHTLRVVIVDEASNKIEANKYYGELADHTTCNVTIPVSSGKKKLYLIANENGAGTLVNDENTGTDLASFLRDAREGDSGFPGKIEAVVFSAPQSSVYAGGSHNIPMSAFYEITVNAGENKGSVVDCGVLYVVRTMTKYSFSFRNNRISESSTPISLYVKTWTLSSMVKDKAYLLPHFDTSKPWGYKGARGTDDNIAWGALDDDKGWTVGGREWKEWLAYVSNKSNVDPDNPSADEGGWLTCYQIPSGAVSGELSHGYTAENGGKGLEIPVDGKDHDGNIVKYLPESKSLKAANFAFEGEQEYFVNVTVEEDGVTYDTFKAIRLPNLRTLFRNTHVRVYVRFGQTMKDDYIYAKIIDWSILAEVDGELIPE